MRWIEKWLEWSAIGSSFLFLLLSSLLQPNNPLFFPVFPPETVFSANLAFVQNVITISALFLCATIPEMLFLAHEWCVSF